MKPEDLDLEKLLEKHPELVVLASAAAYMVLVERSGPKGPDVPGLHERRNSAWRGKGSFGRAPFGPQVRRK